jgi:acetoin utilization deacetylase AcuC-like enzyme
MRAYHCDRFDPPLPEGHRFPMSKYRLLRELVREHLPDVALVASRAAERPELLAAHDPSHVDGVLNNGLADAQWREIGFPWSPLMVERSCHSVGATLEATASARIDGVAMNLAGGTHHAQRAKGSGFCVFNDVAIAAELALRDGVRRVAVVDLDVHQGNGTAEIFQGREDVFTLSLHGDKNFPFRKSDSSLDVPLPKGCDDATYLEALDHALGQLETSHVGRPFDLMFYLAGADAHEGDRLGHLALTDQGMAARDTRVLDLARQWRVPVVVCMAGGYGRDLDRMLRVQLQTVRLCWLSWHARLNDQ